MDRALESAVFTVFIVIYLLGLRFLLRNIRHLHDVLNQDVARAAFQKIRYFVFILILIWAGSTIWSSLDDEVLAGFSAVAVLPMAALLGLYVMAPWEKLLRYRAISYYFLIIGYTYIYMYLVVFIQDIYRSITK